MEEDAEHLIELDLKGVKLHPDIQNFKVDTCSSFYAISKERAREIIDLYGTDRVIFGTDFPMWKQEDELKFLFNLGLSENEL